MLPETTSGFTNLATIWTSSIITHLRFFILFALAKGAIDAIDLLLFVVMRKISENVSTKFGAGELPNLIAKASGFGDKEANLSKFQRYGV